MENTAKQQITILGIGNILFSDEGLGIRAIERLEQRYHFPQNVSLVDGGVLGIHLLGTITRADHLIVIDAIKNQSLPGTLHRLEGDEIPKRVLAKNSLHEVDFLEALAVCQAFDKIPRIVALGIEPLDIETLSLQLSPVVRDRLEDLLDMVVKELKNLGVILREKTEEEQRSYVPCNPC